MLAYSSVEHMGILVLGVGLGRVGVFGSLLHVLKNGLTRGALLRTAGNNHRVHADGYARGWAAAMELRRRMLRRAAPPR
jgi:formate hydrogenlyase subunit 3/multisubunit Na+/H+ antiporter MnhD subunit